MSGATGMLAVIEATLRTLSRPMSGSASISPTSASPKWMMPAATGMLAVIRVAGGLSGGLVGVDHRVPRSVRPAAAIRRKRAWRPRSQDHTEYCPSKARLKVPPTGPTEEMNRASAVRDGPQPPLVS
jgi:hypothetical protein